MAAALFLTSCGGDDEEDPTVQQPTVSLHSTSAISGDATVSTTEELVFKLDLREGGANLKTFTIRQASGSGTPVAPNPNLYTIKDIEGKTITTELDGNYDISSNSVYTITFNALGNPGVYTFIYGLTDKDDVSATPLEVTITVATTFREYMGEKLQGNTSSTSGTVYGQFFTSKTGFNGGSGSWTGDNKPSDIDITYESNASMAKFYSPSTKPSKGSLTGLTVTKYATSNLDFATVTKAQLAAAPAPTATDIDVAVGTFIIENAAGQRGLIEVTALNSGLVGEVTFNVKVLN